MKRLNIFERSVKRTRRIIRERNTLISFQKTLPWYFHTSKYNPSTLRTFRDQHWFVKYVQCTPIHHPNYFNTCHAK